jgi:hypothetical protein
MESCDPEVIANAVGTLLATCGITTTAPEGGLPIEGFTTILSE